jgi:hypothetical protein
MTIPSKAANWIIRKIIGVPLHDIGCGLKAYKNKVVKSIKIYSDMHRFIPLLAAMKGTRISEIIVNHRPRKFGKSKYGLTRIWKVLFDLFTIKMLVHFQNKPIRLFAIFSFFFCVFGLVFGIVSIFLLYQGNRSIIYAGASFLSFFLAGSFISWGILAEFLIRQEKR